MRWGVANSPQCEKPLTVLMHPLMDRISVPLVCTFNWITVTNVLKMTDFILHKTWRKTRLGFI